MMYQGTAVLSVSALSPNF